MRIPVAGWVAPFGDPGINDRSHLPRAFRSVPRPSSPLSAKASTRCPFLARSRDVLGRPSPATQTPRTTAAHRGKPQFGQPQFRRTPLPGFPPPRGVFHEDTSSDGPQASSHPHRSAVRLGHIHKFALPVQSTPLRTPDRRRGTDPARRDRTSGTNLVFSECRLQGSEVRDQGSGIRSRPVIRQTARSRSASAPAAAQCRYRMVEVNGIEPMTSCLQSRRSPN